LANVVAEATGTNTVMALTAPAATDVFPVTFTSNAPATFPVGTTPVTWTATDANGQLSTAIQNVVIQDTTTPVITGTPLAAVVAEATGATTAVTLTAPTATDVFAVTFTSNAPTTFPVGTTPVTWTATDANGQLSTAIQNVVIQDTTLPLITLNPLAGSVILNSIFTDPGAVAADIVDGNVNIVGVGTVNTAVLGPYSLSYDYTDVAGNIASTVTRTVNVVNAPDTTAPVVTAPAPISIEASGATTAVTLGVATVTDNIDAGLTATASPAGPYTVGLHSITWTATDLSGNSGTATQQVTVQDTTPPSLALNGATTVNIVLGAVYNDLGATASDIVDGNITANIGVAGSVNTAIAATYTLLFNVSDVAGNPAATATRTVIVNPAAASWNQFNWDQSKWQ